MSPSDTALSSRATDSKLVKYDTQSAASKLLV